MSALLQVYLVEVNTSPALFRVGAVLTELLPRVVEEVVQKVGRGYDQSNA